MKVIKIGAVWCSGCIVMKPRWQEIERDNPWLKTEYYDFDEDSEKIKKYNIEGEKLPTFIFIDSANQEIDRLHGEVKKEKLIELINEYRDK